MMRHADFGRRLLASEDARAGRPATPAAAASCRHLLYDMRVGLSRHCVLAQACAAAAADADDAAAALARLRGPWTCRLAFDDTPRCQHASMPVTGRRRRWFAALLHAGRPPHARTRASHYWLGACRFARPMRAAAGFAAPAAPTADMVAMFTISCLRRRKALADIRCRLLSCLIISTATAISSMTPAMPPRCWDVEAPTCLPIRSMRAEQVDFEGRQVNSTWLEPDMQYAVALAG